ncbi:hypothetical protein [Citrobacter sp. NCU1]
MIVLATISTTQENK